MSETIEYEQFEKPDGNALAAAAGASGEADLLRLSEIPMQLSVEIGRARTTVGDTLQLRVGAVVELEREAGAAADLLVNGTPIARGEVVVVDERYGLRITEILDAQEPGQEAEPTPAADDAAAAQDAGETSLAEA